MSYEELTPEMPKVIDDQQETVYLPLADYENAGAVRPSKDYFKVLPNAVLVPILEAFVPNLQEKTATKNGPVTPDEGFYGLLKVNVDVPTEESNLISKTIVKNGTYKASEEVDDTIIGIWYLNEVLTSETLVGNNVNYDGDFQAINLDTNELYTYNQFDYVNDNDTLDRLYYHQWDDWVDIEVYKDGQWISDEYRTIVIDKEPSSVYEIEPMLNWLKVNATKITVDGYSEVVVNVEPNVISKTITKNGTYKASEEADDSTLIGTWTFKSNLDVPVEQYLIEFYLDGELKGKVNGQEICETFETVFWGGNKTEQQFFISCDGVGTGIYKNDKWSFNDLAAAKTRDFDEPPTITIIGGDDIDNETFLTWLKANSTKLSDGTIDGYSEVIVDVPAAEPNLISKTITKNGTYKASEEFIVGTWVFNDVIDIREPCYWEVTFATESENIGECKALTNFLFNYEDYTKGYFVYITNNGTGHSAYYQNRWADPFFKTIRITSAKVNTIHGEDFYTWIKANATKIDDVVVDGYSEVIVDVKAEGELDTSDATATADKILKDETAYVNGEKITGSIETYDTIIGTWVLNPSLSYHTEQVTFLINGYSHINPDVKFGRVGLRTNGYAFCGSNANGSNYYLAYYDTNSNPTYSGSYVWFREGTSTSVPFQSLEANETNRTITITGGEDASNKILVDWFKANATRKSDILMTSPNGIILETEGKYVDKDIAIVPTLEEKTVKSTTEKQVIGTSDGYVGVSNITVDPMILMSKTVIKNGTYKARNEGADELQGIWMFKSDKITIPVSPSSPVTYNFNFTTLDGLYTADSIRLVNTGEPYYLALPYELHFCGGNLGDHIAYKARYSDANGMWLSKYLQTITITSILEEVTNGSALLAWLQTNATKLPVDGYSEVKVSIAEWDGSGVVIKEIGSASLITFTIDGTSYQGDEGMTWEEWVESEYNTGDYVSVSGNVFENENLGRTVTNSDFSFVDSSDTIISNYAYLLGFVGGSN